MSGSPLTTSDTCLQTNPDHNQIPYELKSSKNRDRVKRNLVASDTEPSVVFQSILQHGEIRHRGRGIADVVRPFSRQGPFEAMCRALEEHCEWPHAVAECAERAGNAMLCGGSSCSSEMIGCLVRVPSQTCVWSRYAPRKRPDESAGDKEVLRSEASEEGRSRTCLLCKIPEEESKKTVNVGNRVATPMTRKSVRRSISPEDDDSVYVDEVLCSRKQKNRVNTVEQGKRRSEGSSVPSREDLRFKSKKSRLRPLR
jgi:hypothetical protein